METEQNSDHWFICLSLQLMVTTREICVVWLHSIAHNPPSKSHITCNPTKSPKNPNNLWRKLWNKLLSIAGSPLLKLIICDTFHSLRNKSTGRSHMSFTVTQLYDFPAFSSVGQPPATHLATLNPSGSRLASTPYSCAIRYSKT